MVVDGVVYTAANVDRAWIGTNAADEYSRALGGRQVARPQRHDAAGLAEQRYGAGRNHKGVVVLLTFGAGIGSAVIHNGMLPNTEFGHARGRRQGNRAPGGVLGQGNQGLELPAVGQTGEQGPRRGGERDLARSVHHRRRRNQLAARNGSRC